jgi:hypothetical protein
MTRPRKFKLSRKYKPFSPWYDMHHAPQNEIVLGCEGIGAKYHVFEMIQKNGKWQSLDGKTCNPAAWMPRPTPPAWLDIMHRIERIMKLEKGAIIRKKKRHYGRELVARQIFCWMAFNRYGHSVSEIGRALNCDHSTASQHIDTVDRNLERYLTTIEIIDQYMTTN